MRRALLLGVLAFVTPRLAAAANGTTPGAVTAPYPTLENLALEWALTGDDNANATASVRYRKVGASSFRNALPLFRVPAGNNQGFSWENKLAGSIFGLEPGTEYEIELTLSDPDGGDATETLTAKTRPLPVVPATARSVPVVPSSLAAALDAATPGDVLVLADGSYDTFAVPNDGTERAPIVIRAASAGKAVIEGDVRLDGRAHVFLEDLTVHGKIKMNDADSVVVRGCTVETPDYGIIAYGSGITNAVIINNVVTGTTVWREASLGTDGDNNGEGIQFTGPGNVVAYNRVSGFRDCLSLMEDDEAAAQIADDFYGNDLSACADDAVEADFAMGNVRVYGNRIRDSFMGISSQPSLGGPTYFLRNAMYNVLFQAFKLQRSSVGDVGFHNTIVKSGDAFSVNTEDVFSRATFRNNLFIGGPGDTYNGYDSGAGDIMMLPSADASCSFDYDGYGSIGTGTFAGRVGDVRFDGLDGLHTLTSEAHALAVDLGVFAADVTFPADPFAAPATPSLLLASGGDAIDQGIPLANVNDDFAGKAPDLGAFELGASEPVYGPGGDVSSPDGGDTAGAAGQTAAENGGGGGTTSGGRGGTSSNDGGTSSGGTATGGASTGARGGKAGATNSGGTATAGATSTASGGDGSDEDSGCGCSVPHRSSHAASAVALALGLALSRMRRRVRSAPRSD